MSLLCLFVLVGFFMLPGCARKEFKNPFDPKNRPGELEIISPKEGEIVLDNPPDFLWGAIVADSAFYHFQLDDDSSFSSPLMNDSMLNRTLMGLSSSLPLGEFYWRIRGAKAFGAWGDWSKTHKFSVKYAPVYEGEILNFPMSIEVYGNYAYIRENGRGLSIFDVSEPAKPKFVGTWGDPYISFAKVFGNYAYCLTSGPSRMTIVDVSNPANPSRVSEYYCNWIGGLAVDGNFVYLGTRDTISIGDSLRYFIWKIDVRDKRNPRRVANWNSMFWKGVSTIYGSMAIFSDFLFMVVDTKIMIFHTYSPNKLAYVGDINYKGKPFYILVQGNEIYLIEQGLIEVFDVSNPEVPVKTGEYRIIGTDEVFVEGDIVYSIPRSTLSIDNFRTRTHIGSTKLSIIYHYIYVSGNYAYLVSYMYSYFAVVRVK